MIFALFPVKSTTSFVGDTWNEAYVSNISMLYFQVKSEKEVFFEKNFTHSHLEEKWSIAK